MIPFPGTRDELKRQPGVYFSYLLFPVRNSGKGTAPGTAWAVSSVGRSEGVVSPYFAEPRAMRFSQRMAHCFLSAPPHWSADEAPDWPARRLGLRGCNTN